MTITWKNGSPLPMARPRYYDHQYLRAADLAQAVDYLLARQNLVARLLHPVGVVKGLTLTPTGSDITVGEGVAVDTDGSVIVVPEDRRVALTADGTFYVSLRYREWLTDRRDEGGVAAETRWTEEGQVEVTTTRPDDPNRSVVLGRVTRNQGVVTVDNTDRVVAGLRVPVGAIVPAIGNSRQAGIQFPSDPGGGTGDEAFIRYFATSGENTVLRLGVGNEAEDAIDFYQAGANRLRISRSMLQLGSLDGGTVVADQVVAGLGFWGPGAQHAQLSFRAGRGFELVDRSNDGPSLDYGLHSRAYTDLELRELRAATVRGRGGLGLVTDGTMTVRSAGGLHLIKEAGASGDLSVQGNLAVGGDVYLAGSRYVTANGRMHLNGSERLYLLNHSGVYIGYGGGAGPETGCLWVENRGFIGGNAQINGTLGVRVSPNSLPDWSGGGIGTFDMFVSGALYAGPLGGPYPVAIDAAGRIQGKTKQFVIDHPLDDPADPNRRVLVHAAVEGPENGVYYRGEGRLVDGAATVELPTYFEALTLPEGRTVQLTPVFEDDEPVSPLAASRVAAGEFRVRTADGSKASHAFYWQVFAVRADLEPLETEVSAATIQSRRAAPPSETAGLSLAPDLTI
ncbi:hypothetical protein ACWDV4_20740 [Micromonospora sp. NPDC003197]